MKSGDSRGVDAALPIGARPAVNPPECGVAQTVSKRG